MRACRSLIGSVFSLAAGLALIFVYCQGNTNLNVGYPLSGSVLHVEFTTAGPAVLGGLLLVGVGLLLMVVALLTAIVGEIARLMHSDKPRESGCWIKNAPS